MNGRYIRGIKIDWNDLNIEEEQDTYYRNIPALNSVEEIEFSKNITFFVGENGTGKSTLLEAAAVAFGFNPEGGSLNYRFSSMDTHASLYKHIRIARGTRRPKDGFFLRAESFYNVSTKMGELAKNDYGGYDSVFLEGYGGKFLHEQSHGESFLAIIQNRFWGNGVYILDEPEAALSPQRQLTLLIHISSLAAKGSQFLIATHSPILLGMPEAQIYSFDNGKITEIAYEDADCYQVMEMYINHREVLLNRLLDNGPD